MEHFEGCKAQRVSRRVGNDPIDEALAKVGRQDEARAMMAQLDKVQSPLGLLAEDLDPAVLVAHAPPQIWKISLPVVARPSKAS